MVNLRAKSMNDTQRIIGEFKEFKRATLHELASIQTKVDQILVFQTQVKTAVKLGHVVVGFVSSVVSTALTLFVTKG